MNDKLSMDRGGAFSRQVLPFLLIVMFCMFFAWGPGYNSMRHLKASWDLGHILFFALLPYTVFTRFGRRFKSYWHQCLFTVAASIVLGTFIEIAQYGFQRDVDIFDIFRDVIGGFVGMFFLLPARKGVRKKWLRILQSITLCLVGLNVYPVMVAFVDEYIARKQFPVLSTFETPWEIRRWKGSADYSIDDKVSFTGDYALRVLLKTDMYSGVSLFYFPENWEGAKGFHFSVYNPSAEPLYLTCRIHDQNHSLYRQVYTDRFNRTYSMATGWRTIMIDVRDIRDAPDGRQMDLKHIRGVMIFATGLRQSRVVYIDDVGLEF